MSATTDPNLPLTRRQASYVEAIVNDPFMSRTEAAILAGYDPKFANAISYQLWVKPHVRAEIDRRVAERDREQIIHKKWIFDNLKELVERCMNPERFNPAAANAALRTAAQCIGLFTDKKPDKPRGASLDEVLPAIIQAFRMLGFPVNESRVLVQESLAMEHPPSDMDLQDYLKVLQAEEAKEDHEDHGGDDAEGGPGGDPGAPGDGAGHGGLHRGGVPGVSGGGNGRPAAGGADQGGGG